MKTTLVGCLIWGIILPSSMDILINHYKDPCFFFFFRGSGHDVESQNFAETLREFCLFLLTAVASEPTTLFTSTSPKIWVIIRYLDLPVWVPYMVPNRRMSIQHPFRCFMGTPTGRCWISGDFLGFQKTSSPSNDQVSDEKKPGCLGDLLGMTSFQVIWGLFHKPLIKDPYQTTRIQWNVTTVGFFRGEQVASGNRGAQHTEAGGHHRGDLVKHATQLATDPVLRGGEVSSVSAAAAEAPVV